MNLSGFIVPFTKLSEWFMKFFLLNSLWLFCNFPIVYLLLDTIFRESVDEVLMIFIAIIVLLPFLFFPSTAAMFAIVRRYIMQLPVGNIGLSFFRYYKENYFRSLIGSLLFLPLYGMWLWNFLIADVVLNP